MGIRYGGRQKGTPNKATTAFAEACRAFLDDPVAWKRMAKEYRNGTLDPRLVVMLFAYAHGKPKEQIEHSGGLRISWLT